MTHNAQGFSKRSKHDKINWLLEHFIAPDQQTAARSTLEQFWQSNPEVQRVIDGFSENTLSNFVMPYGIAPNFVINDREYVVPMVIEESSVVAAASAAAKFWQTRGGFRAQVLDTQKVGQVHFTWTGERRVLFQLLDELRQALVEEAAPLTANMEKRNGGILDIDLIDFTQSEKYYYQLRPTFETCDSMGANFINSVLEQFGQTLTAFLTQKTGVAPTVIMAILSNYTPDCLVRAWVECPVADFGEGGEALAQRFRTAVNIARIDPYRATTHNKGIFNGIDAVILATANDFRAVEACGHAYAARDGQYRSLSQCTIENAIFRFWLDLPLAIGTVGGLTKLHPLANLSLQILGNPSARELMQIVAVVGLAQNFAALRSLVTTGIQRGHMKMHLTNILNHLHATPEQMQNATTHFADKTVSFNAVRDFLAIR
jgi:hydroxymethylglutaryl-CoA reductase